MRPRRREASLLSICLLASACKEPSRTRRRAVELRREAEQALLRGDLETAAERLRRAQQRRPRDPDLASRLGLVLWYQYLATGDESFQEEALAHLRASCSSKGHCAACCVNLGNALWLAGRPQEAARAYELALSWAPDHPDVEILRDRIRWARESRSAVGDGGRDGGVADPHTRQPPVRSGGRSPEKEGNHD